MFWLRNKKNSYALLSEGLFNVRQYDVNHKLSRDMRKPTMWKTDNHMHQPSLIRVFAVHMKKAWAISCPGNPPTERTANTLVMRSKIDYFERLYIEIFFFKKASQN